MIIAQIEKANQRNENRAQEKSGISTSSGRPESFESNLDEAVPCFSLTQVLCVLLTPANAKRASTAIHKGGRKNKK